MFFCIFYLTKAGLFPYNYDYYFENILESCIATLVYIFDKIFYYNMDYLYYVSQRLFFFEFIYENLNDYGPPL